MTSAESTAGRLRLWAAAEPEIEAECKDLRKAVAPPYRSCKETRLCDLVDPALLDHRWCPSLGDYRELAESIELGSALMSLHLNEVSAWPDRAVGFLKLLCTSHHRLLGTGLPTIAGRFRTSAEAVVFGGNGAHRREGVAGERIEIELRQLYEATPLASFASEDPHTVAMASAIFLTRFFRIHPFLDGNGRVGRAMIALLCRLGGTYWLPRFDPSPRSRRRYLKALQYAHRYADEDRMDRETPRCPPLFLAIWLRHQLAPAPSSDLEEMGPPSLPPDFDD